MSWAVDAHCHISDQRVFEKRQQWISNCLGRGIKWFVLGGVDPTDWDRQSQLQSEFPENIFCCYGLHPYFVSQASECDLEQGLEVLKARLPQCEFLGEMGLDFRKEIVGDRRHLQEQYFVRQLVLAERFDKIAVLHVVRAHQEALQILSGHSIRGLVHAFNSSWEIAQKYLALGLYLSLGAKILAPEHQRLLVEIPLDRILIESDAPDQPPRGMREHDSTTILLIAQAIADNKGLTADQVLEKTRKNMESLLGRSLCDD